MLIYIYIYIYILGIDTYVILERLFKFIQPNVNLIFLVITYYIRTYIL